MGNRRKPTARKRLEGTFRPDRAPGNEPTPEGTAEPPDFLTAEARQEWDRLAPELEAIGLLTVADRGIFAGYCQAWADYLRLTVQLNDMASWVWESEKGYRQAVPELAMRKEAWTRAVQAGSRLGLDPTARSGLHVELRSKDENPFAKHGKHKNPFAEIERLGR